jgi:3',5'-cyclic AMP phosphodiesterase CpdA
VRAVAAALACCGLLAGPAVLAGCSADDGGESGGAAATDASSGDEVDAAAHADATSAADGSSDELAPFRIVVMADSHVIGPSYVGPEGDELDTNSIYKTEQRLKATRDIIATIDPPPDLVIVNGDVVHDAYPYETFEEYLEKPSPFSICQEIYETFPVPVYFVWGNHDYHVPSTPKALSHKLFAHFFGAKPYEVVEHKGWKFVLANGQMGPSWDPTSDRYDKGKASYGAEQLAWMDDELSEGKPTIMFSHYSIPIVTLWDENPDAADPALGDYKKLLEKHKDTVKLSLAGHTHRWIDYSEATPVPHFVIGATRYDEDNFWLLELDPVAETVDILDLDKARWFNWEGDKWRYDGTPRPADTNPDPVGGTDDPRKMP